MEKNLQDRFSEAGIPDEVVAILEDQKLTNCSVLERVDMPVLIMCGIKVGDAMLIKDLCKVSKQSSSTVDRDYESYSCGAQDLEKIIDVSMDESACLIPKPAASSEPLTSPELPTVSHVQSPFLFQEKRNRTFFENFKLVDKFSPAVSSALEKNCLTGLQRNEFIRDICTNILANGIHYVNKDERNKVALSIITKYPHLKDSIGSGVGSWLESIRNRFKHIRKYDAKKRKALEPAFYNVATLGTNEKVSSSMAIKKRRNDFWNVVPNVQVPEAIHLEHVAELKKETAHPPVKQDKIKIKQLMLATFEKRRCDILTKVIPVQEIVVEYPPLATVVGIRHEFCKLLDDENCMIQMGDKLSKYESTIVKYCEQLPRKKPYIKNVLKMLNIAISRDAERTEEFESTFAVVALPQLLARKVTNKKEGNDLIDILYEGDDFNGAVRNTTFPKLLGVGDDIFTLHRLVICAEGNELVDVTVNPIKTALLSLHALYYIFSIQYPKEHKDMFIFMDSMLLGLQHAMSNKIAVHKFVKDLECMHASVNV